MSLCLWGWSVSCGFHLHLSLQLPDSVNDSDEWPGILILIKLRAIQSRDDHVSLVKIATKKTAATAFERNIRTANYMRRVRVVVRQLLMNSSQSMHLS